LITLVLNGLEGSITVNGETFINAMPQHSFLTDEEAANVLTYIRQNFGNKASEIKPQEIKAIRNSLTSKKKS
jgi:mono/diheme cytochrome c family protein